MDDAAICCAARHEWTTKPQEYYQDAMTRFVEFQMVPRLAEENRVAPWRPNFVQNEVIRKTLSLDGMYEDTIDKLADDYVKKELHIDIEKARNVTYANIIKQAVEMTDEQKSTKDEINELTSDLPGSKRQQILACFHRHSANYRLQFAGAREGDGDDGEFI